MLEGGISFMWNYLVWHPPLRSIAVSAELSLNKARGNIWPRPQACRATNQNLGSSHRVALNEHCRHCCLVVNCHNCYMHIQATAQKTSIDSNYNRSENKINRICGPLPKYQYASLSQEKNTNIFRAFTLAKLSISSVSQRAQPHSKSWGTKTLPFPFPPTPHSLPLYYHSLHFPPFPLPPS